MEELSLHIEYLLLWHDCVIMPGFGAFIAGRRGARIDHASGKILPPLREVVFNREVTTDDGLLAHSVARREGLTFEEGRVKMLAAIAEIKNHLLNEKEVTLGHVGTLLLEEEGNIVFHPFRSAEAGSIAMGMYETSMIFSPSLKEASQISAEAQEESNSVVKARVNSVDDDIKTPTTESDQETREETDNVAVTTESVSSPYYTIRIRKTYAHIAASFILICVLAVSLLLPSAERTSDKTLASVVPVEAISKTVRTSAVAPEKTSKPSIETASDVEETSLPYYLIVATFRTPEEADRYIAQSTDEGLIRVDGNRLHRVAIKGDSNRGNLQTLLNTREFKEKYPGAWIWESKKH